MTKALFRKQMMEVFDMVFRHGRHQRQRSYAGTILSIAALVFVLYILGRFLYNIADVTCELFLSESSGWSYFAVVGILATVFGVLSSVFTVHSTVYQAKDTDLLLSMPIPPGMIMLMRLCTSYLICFLFETVVTVPFYIVYWKTFHPGFVPVLLDFLILLVFPFLALVISCVMGWILAFIDSIVPKRIRNIISFIISFVFVLFFLNLCLRASSYMQILQNGAKQSNALMQLVTYPFVSMGRSALGSVGAFLVLFLTLAVLSGIMYLLLGKSFRNFSHSGNRGKNKTYREQNLRSASPEIALLKKDFRRYFSSSTYFMNSSIGSILMLLCFALMIWNYHKLQNSIAQMQMFSDTIPMMICIVILCILIGVNTIAASSISVEGNNLWLLKSLPITERKTINEKMILPLIVTLIPQLLCSGVAAGMLQKDMMQVSLVVVVPFLFSVSNVELGLLLNLFYPKLDWISESNAVRRSTSTRLSVLISWASILLAIIVYSRLPDDTDLIRYLICLTVILCLLIAGLFIWIHQKGRRMLFE